MSITNTLETYKLIGIKEGERSMLELVLELSKQLQEQGKGIEELDKVLRRYFTNGCN